MRRIGLVAAILAALLSSPTATALSTPGRRLTFEQRVRAQEAIERVYYAHQTGATMPFEEAVPREVLERKVRTYLQQSVALERLWNTPVDAWMLQRETERMAHGSRMPGRLLELYAALDNDPVLIIECLARAMLVDRLIRSFQAFDQRIHGGAGREAAELRRQLVSGEIDPHADHPRRTMIDIKRDDVAGHTEQSSKANTDTIARTLTPEQFDEWAGKLPRYPGEIGPVQEERDAFLVQVVLEHEPDRIRAVSYRVAKRSWDEWWSTAESGFSEDQATTIAWDETISLPPPTSSASQTGQGAALLPCAPNDTWDNGSLDASKEGREGHSAVWTGSVMLVWGGWDGAFSVSTGGRYDPATDTWTSISTTGAPAHRYLHTAVWTGSEMIVWGGCQNGGCFPMLNSGGRYEPVTNTWTPTSFTNAPSARSGHNAVWTGNLMVVWGGNEGSSYAFTGSRYDPATNTWRPTSTSDAPSARIRHIAVWTGSLMVVWGGSTPAGYSDTGARYDPVTDTWTPTSTTTAPLARVHHTAVWTGDLMVVWGGSGGSDNSSFTTRTGGRYDPATDTWTPTSLTNSAQTRASHTAVWTGSVMVVWGGRAGGLDLLSGGRYDPTTDSWTPTSGLNTPSERYSHTAVWTGNLMVIWGGVHSGIRFNGGGRYDPVTDTWTPASTTHAPTERSRHTAVWTGSVMIVWGGSDGGQYRDTGGRYDPVTDTWTPTATADVPSARHDHTAVWTGSVMVVWGGSTNMALDTGGRYDPVSDSWTSTSLANGPEPRSRHTAVWTGSRMVVWGGLNVSQYLDTGGRYDPVKNKWTVISETDAPAERALHSAVWTGSEMIVWGGYNGYTPYVGTGGRYNPINDNWTSTSMFNAPSARGQHTAVWTGSGMVVWGGADAQGRSNTGSRYYPSSNTWSSMSTTNAPSARTAHTAVWTGNLMIVWGGYGDNMALDTGGRYDPDFNVWTATSTTNGAPASSDHAAVWAEGLMIVWGGWDIIEIDSGGRYGPSPHPDLDTDGYDVNCDCDDTDASIHPGGVQVCGDGVNNDCSDPAWPSLSGTNESDEDGDSMTECAGDCDDTRASVRPSAPQLCDGLNNDCNAAGWPTPPANEADQDADGVPICGGDCDDTQASVRPGAPEICDGINNDCNEPSWPAITPAEADQDADGFKPCSGDCDDGHTSVKPGAPQICGDGLNNNCNDPAWPALNGTNERDDDADGYTECGGDCDDLSEATHPGAAEVNDGLDNQCPAEPGFGSVDEVNDLWFPDASDTTRICWVDQPGATTFRLTVSGDRFGGIQECGAPVTAACDNDVPSPPPGKAFFYRVRAETPFAGSWGQSSTGAETNVTCGAGDPLSEFTFDDELLVDDISDDALFDFFNQMSTPSPSGYILVEVESSPGNVDSLCSRRPDFYRANYLSLATSGGVVMSGTWDKWYRPANGGWQGPVTSGISDRYGSSCSAPYSWCAMWGLGGVWLWMDPAATQECEVSNDSAGCGTGSRLRIRVGSDRLRTCGF